MAKYNRFVRWSSSGIAVSGALMLFSLCFLKGAGHAGEPSAVPLAQAPAHAAVPAPPPMLARPPEETSPKADRLLPATAKPAGVNVAAGPGWRDAHRGVDADGDAYRCHPNEDIACTVVRETARGVTVTTMRPGRSPSQAASWSVVRGAPPGAVAYPGGIIYVVPTTSPAPSAFQGLAETIESAYTANNSPILE